MPSETGQRHHRRRGGDAGALNILLTGAAGGLGGKLLPHLEDLGWQLRLTDILPTAGRGSILADLSRSDTDWNRLLDGIDVVIHLGGVAAPSIDWPVALRHNVDATINLMQAAAARGVRRLVFASSTWAVAGRAPAAGVVLDSLSPPQPDTAYGSSKLFGERLGAMIAAASGLSVIALRIGWCPAGPNLAPPAAAGLWDQRKWLSDADLCAGFAAAVTAPASLRSAVVTLVSDNAGMAWDLEEARRLIGYTPGGRSVPITPDAGRPAGTTLPRRLLRRFRRLAARAWPTSAAVTTSCPPGLPASADESRVTLAFRAEATLGEGPHWSAAEACLYWIDVLAPAVHRFDLASGAVRSQTLPSPVGAVAGCAAGGLLVATQAGVLRLEDGRPPETLATPEPDRPGNRLNDGKCDRAGRFWVGSMAIDGTPRQGSLYRIEPNGRTTCMDRGFSLCNGLGWSPDDRTMYLTDTPNGRIYAYDFDLAAGEIANRRILVQVEEGTGFADGLAVDAEGCLWSAHWDGWRVTRYDPSGRRMSAVALPVPRPTSCAFGGANLDQLYVTSARLGLSRDDLRQAPLSGSLFTIDVGVAGSQVGQFGLGWPSGDRS